MVSTNKQTPDKPTQHTHIRLDRNTHSPGEDAIWDLQETFCFQFCLFYFLFYIKKQTLDK